MRVTSKMSADSSVYNIMNSRAKLDGLNEKLSSGRQVNRPSDNPIATRQILDLEEQIKAAGQHLDNIKNARIWLNVNATTLDTMSEMVAKARQVANSISSGTQDVNVRNNALSMLTAIHGQLVDLGNTQVGSQYLYGGFKTTQPFDTAGNFSGTNDNINVEIAPNTTMAINYPGDKLLVGGTPPAAVVTTPPAGAQPVNLLGSITALKTAVANNDINGIVAGLQNLESASAQIVDAQSDVAGRMIRVDNTEKMLTRNQNILRDILSTKQEVDYSKTITELNQQKIAYEAALSTTAKITPLSLLDFLR